MPVIPALSQDRAPAVLRDHPELARPTPGHPRDRRRDHRGDHHQDRTEHPAALDTNTYQKGIRITDKAMKAFEAAHLQRHTFHGNWNYTVTGTPADTTTHPNRPDLIQRKPLVPLRTW